METDFIIRVKDQLIVQQHQYGLNRLNNFISREDYDKAKVLRDCIVRFQDKDFNLEDVSYYRWVIKH